MLFSTLSLPKFISAFLVFVCISWFSFAFKIFSWQNPLSLQESLKENTWTTWAIKDFLRPDNQAADLVLLGSSLVLMPVNLSDATFLNEKVDGAIHHRSIYLEDLLQKQLGQSLSSFNLSIPGEMPSDAFLILKNLLLKQHAPKLIVYGLGPRDFLDNLLAEPTATDPYRCLSRLGSSDNPSYNLSYDKGFYSQAFYGTGLYNRSTAQVLDYLGNYVLYFNQKRQDLALKVESWAKLNLHRQLSLLSTKTFSSVQVRALLPQFHPMEIDIGESLFLPENQKYSPHFKDNLAEYRKRYGTTQWHTYITQLYFFNRFLELARANNINVLVLAMPITTVNQSLLPKPIWNMYLTDLHFFSHLKSAHFLDLQLSHCFSDKDFMDTVHLNSRGGKKLIQLIANEIGHNNQLRAAFGTRAVASHDTNSSAIPKENL